MKNVTRLSPEAIERLQEPARVDEGIESSEARDSSSKRGVGSFAAADPDRVMVLVDAVIFAWFREHIQPGESPEAAIHRVLTNHIAEETKRRTEGFTSSAA